jgi:hypothetical protein
MLPSGRMLGQMLSDLKSRQGASLDDLLHTLPEHYQVMDYDPRYLVFEAIVTLVKWGLVEAYDGTRLLTTAELSSTSRHDWPRQATFYISRQAFEMEEALGVRLNSAGDQVFKIDSLYSRPKSAWPEVFVLMPFDPALKPVYEDHIVSVIRELKLTVGRADDFFTNGHIMGEVWTAINQADIIIADCTNRNPNVFYEVGIAHAMGKQTILMVQTIDDIPFDLRGLRVIEYRYDPRGMTQFEEALRKTIMNIKTA